MQQSRILYHKILSVCINKRQPNEVCCAHRGSEAIAETLKSRIKTLGLSRQIRVSKSGCQDVCAKGPNVMIFPDCAWYSAVGPDDIELIILDLTRDLHSSSSTPAV